MQLRHARVVARECGVVAACGRHHGTPDASQAPKHVRRWLAACAASVCFTRTSLAHACGVSASGAPAGICDATEVLDEKAAGARNRIGASYGYTSSVLFFSNNLREPTERHAVMASFEHPMPKRWTLEIGAGSLLGGTLGTATFSPGVLLGVSLSHLVIQPRGYASPFLLLSFGLAGVWALTSDSSALTTTRADYVAFDFNAAAAAGVSLKVGRHAITPFLGGRLFGGPVFWTHDHASVLGTDAYKYSLGPGVALSFAHARLSVTVGASLLGEKNLRSGFSLSF